MSVDSQQLELIAAAKAEPISVALQDEIARRCRSRHDAILKTYEASQLSPCQVYGPLGWSQGQFAKIYGGSKFLPQEDYHNFQRLCGNWILLRYDALQAEHEIKPVVSDAEARIKRLEAELADRDRAIKLLGDMLRGGR
jgi:hypothetical protein